MTDAITGGSVSYERNVKVADYESKKATITFNVNNEAGQDGASQVAAALTLAVATVNAALGLAEATPQVEAVVAAKKTRAKKTDTTAERQITTSPEDRKDPANPETPSTADMWGGPAAAPAPAPAPITDADLAAQLNHLYAGVQKKLGEKAPASMHALIMKYGGPPAQKIEASKRQAFLDEVKALT